MATDWGIINKTLQKVVNNVFVLYLDLQTGWIAAYPRASRGQAGVTLAQYCQEHGAPQTILHDNAQEYLTGEFAEICKQKEVQQKRSAPYTPTKIPRNNTWASLWIRHDTSFSSRV